MPYSFSEFQLAHDLPKAKPPFGRQAYDVANKQMIDFFNRGGFPAVQQMQSHDWRETLQSYVDTVILKDIIERHNVSNIAVLKYLAKTLLSNAATLFSINKFYNDIKSQGYNVSRETIHHYVDYIEDAFLIFNVPVYIDFVTVDKNGERELIQVTWDMTDQKTSEREQRALLFAEQELGIKGRIITSREYAVQQIE